MVKVIGIISYLPDDEHIRELRFQKLNKLIVSCNQLLKLPIHIIIQNYKEEEISHLSEYKNVSLSKNYSRCGIVGARKKLREWFLTSAYDCLIMLDDDCELVGTARGGKIYLEELEQHRSGYGEFRGTQLKLFSVTRDLLQYVDFDENINPEKGDGFEDTLFVNTLKRKFPKRGFEYRGKELSELSLGVGDELSTWYTNQNLKIMLNKTNKVKVRF